MSKTIFLYPNPDFDTRHRHGISKIYQVFCKEYNYNLEIINDNFLEAYIPDNNDSQILVIAGGDGTIHRAINSIPEESFKKYIFGIIPGGTANEFAKSLYLPLSISKSAQLIAKQNKVFNYCIGLVNNQYKFATGILYGFAVYVLKNTPNFAKNLFGTPAFYVRFLYLLFNFSRFDKLMLKEFRLNSEELKTSFLLINKASLISKGYMFQRENLNKFWVIYFKNIVLTDFLRLMIEDCIHNKYFFQDRSAHCRQMHDILLQFEGNIGFLIDGEHYCFNSSIQISLFKTPLRIICK